MDKILSEEQAELKSNELRGKGLKVVLVGGCFDLLHIGHIKFLKEAKKYGVVFVLLESDESVKKLKGDSRPLNPLGERAEILASISYLDYIVPLEGIKSNRDYDKIVSEIKPDFIAITKGDTCESYKEKQAKNINAKIIAVTEKIKDKSSSKLIKLFKNI